MAERDGSGRGPGRRDVLRQSGPGDCGLVALEMVLAFHGAVGVRPALRAVLGFGGAGTTVLGIVSAARTVGFDADAFSVSVRQLEEVPLPAILHWRRGHYVVLERMARGRFVIVDPAVGRRSMRVEELRLEFSGIVIALERMDSGLAPDRRGAADAPFRTPMRWRDWGWSAALVLLSALALTAAAPHVGILVQSAVDGATRPASLWWVLGCAAMVVLAERGLSAVDRRATARLGAAVAEYFVDGVEGAPPAYVASRTPHFLEHAARDVDPLFYPNFPRLAGVARAAGALALAVVVARASAPAAAAIVLLGAARALSVGIERTRAGKTRAARGQLYAVRERLRAIFVRPEDLLAVGGLGYALRQWLAGRQRVAAAWSRSSGALRLPLGVGLTATLTVTFVVALVEQRRGRLSFGEVVEVQLLAAAALVMWWTATAEYGRLLAWIDNVATLRDIRRDRSAVEPAAASVEMSVDSTTPLLECSGVAWASPQRGAPVLRDVELVVRAGDAVAVIGDSGSGKTLLAQLVLGLRDPSRGRILVSGVALRELNESARGSVIAGVLDDATPMDGTIGEFLRSTRHASDDDLRRACAMVGLGDWIAGIPLGFNAPISRGGAGFASHERRLLVLARLLLLRPTVMVLDGTLDALDSRRASGIAEAVAHHVDATVLLTARPDIVPPRYRRQYLTEGRLRGDGADIGRIGVESST